MADEEILDAEEGQEEPAGAAEFVPEGALKPKSDVFTLLLILSFIAFLGGCVIAGRECWEHYDVQFFMFSKK